MDSTITIVRLPVHWTLRKSASGRACRCGITLLFPVTAGVENFNLEGLPDHVDALGFFPGVQLELPRTEHWTLKVTGQIGWGTRQDGSRESAQLYGAGLRSRYAWPEVSGRPALIQGLYWSGYRPEGGASESLARFSTGAEFNLPIPPWKFRDQTMRLMPHVLADWYFNPLDIPQLLTGSPSGVRLEWELGLAAGRGISGLQFLSVTLPCRRLPREYSVKMQALVAGS